MTLPSLDQAAAEAARFDLPTDAELRTLGARVGIRAARAGAAAMRALLDGLDRDIFAETIRDLGLGHQPRDHAVPCTVCHRETWHPHRTCPQHTDTCEQCCVPGSLDVTR